MFGSLFSKPVSKLPSNERIQEWCTVPTMTPDLAILNRREKHLLFDYGVEFTHVKPLTHAYTVEKMALWNKTPNGDGVNVVAMRLPGIPRARVYGNLYALDTDQLVYLDKSLQNGLSFRRKRVLLNTPFIDDQGKVTRNEAWMYVGLTARWATPIEWDTSFYRGRGEFRLADIEDEQPEYRALRIGRHYRSGPSKYPICAPSACPHYRTEAAHEMVQARDAFLLEREREERRFQNNLASRYNNPDDQPHNGSKAAVS